MAIGWTGSQSAGKSQLMAVHAVEEVLLRNIKWKEEREKLDLPFIPRTMAFDSPMAQHVIDLIESHGFKYIHFTTLTEILPLVEVDVFIHEIVRWFPARGSDPLVPEQAEFLSQADKEGVFIYFCCQDYSQVHKGFRIHVSHLYLVVKMMGSERPVRSAPPVKRIWGLVLYWDLDPKTFQSDNTDIQRDSWWPHFYYINREDTQLYDTSYRVRGNQPSIYWVPQTNIYLSEHGEVLRKETKYIKR